MSYGPAPSRRALLGSLAAAAAGLAGGAGSTSGESTARTTTAQTVSRWPLAGYDTANTKHTGHDAAASPPTDPGIGWNLVRERAFGSPAVSDGRVFVQTSRGDSATLYALGATDGTVQWEYDLGFEFGENAGPAVDGERVVVGGSTVRAFDPATGELLWETDAVDYCQATPTISDGTVYAVCQSDDRAETHLFAFDAATGELLWETGRAGESHYPPVAVGDSVYLDGVAFARADGSKRWERSLPGHPITYPVVADGTLFLTADTGGADGVQSQGRVSALDAADGSTRWTAGTDGTTRAMPAYADGTVYVGDRNGGLYAFDALNGTRRWKRTVDAEVVGPPLVAGGDLLVVSGTRLSVRNPATGAERAVVELPGYVSGWLAAAGDRVFVGATAAGDADTRRLWGLYAVEAGEVTLPDPSVSVNTDPVRVDQPADLAATLGTEPDRPVAYEWEVFDMQSNAPDEPVATFTGKSGTFTPSASHRYLALLRVTVDGGVTDYATAVLAVRQPTPTPSPSPTATLSPTRTPTASPTGSATPSPSPTDRPTGTPAASGGGMAPILLGGTGLLGAGGLAYGAYRYLGGSGGEPGDGPSPAAGAGGAGPDAADSNASDAGFGTAPEAGTDGDAGGRSDPTRAPDPTPAPDASAGPASGAAGSAPEPPAEPSFDAVDLGPELTRLGRLVANEATVDGEPGVVWTLGEYDGTLTVETTTAFAEAADTWARIGDLENIVPVLGWGTAPIPWLATADTGTPLPDCQLDREATLSVLVDACEGVHNGHRYGVAHGTLSPAALRVTDATGGAPGCAVDRWRLPTAVRSRLDLEPRAGAYRAPELASGAAPDDRSDTYALAAITYEALTGHQPFTELTLRDPDGPATVANLEPVGAFDETLSGTVSETIRAALAADPDERVETALYLRDALREVGRDE